jgi:hypothetical protein
MCDPAWKSGDTCSLNRRHIMFPFLSISMSIISAHQGYSVQASMPHRRRIVLIGDWYVLECPRISVQTLWAKKVSPKACLPQPRTHTDFRKRARDSNEQAEEAQVSLAVALNLCRWRWTCCVESLNYETPDFYSVISNHSGVLVVALRQWPMNTEVDRQKFLSR